METTNNQTLIYKSMIYSYICDLVEVIYGDYMGAKLSVI